MNRPECEHRAKPVLRRGRGDEKDERAAGAMPAQIDARWIDVRLLRQEISGSEHVINLAVEALSATGVVVPAAQRRIHRDDSGRRVLSGGLIVLWIGERPHGTNRVGIATR